MNPNAVSDSLVIIPTYNEKENIPRMLDTVMALTPKRGEAFHVLVVDDGSPTARRTSSAAPRPPPRPHPPARTLRQAGPRHRLHRRVQVEPRARVRVPLRNGRGLQPQPKDLERLREACLDGAGVAVGSRYCKGGGVSNWPWHRIAMSYGASLYVNVVLGLGLEDPTAGFKCYRAETLRTIRLDHIHFVGYAFQIEMKYNARKLGFPIAEVPITFVDRELGTSKMSLNIFREAFLGVLQMRRFDIQPVNPDA